MLTPPPSFLGPPNRFEKMLDIMMITFGVVSAAFGTADSLQNMRDAPADAVSVVPPVSTSP